MLLRCLLQEQPRNHIRLLHDYPTPRPESHPEVDEGAMPKLFATRPAASFEIARAPHRFDDLNDRPEKAVIQIQFLPGK